MKATIQISPGGNFKVVKIEGATNQEQCRSMADKILAHGKVDESSREDRPQDLVQEQQTDVSADA